MSNESIRSPKPVLEPIDRISEVLSGLIMVLTFTGSLSGMTIGVRHTNLLSSYTGGAPGALALTTAAAPGAEPRTEGM